MRVGLIGLGNMGRPMARNLLKAGFELTVHNRSRPPVEEMVRAGARGATSPREVAQHCEVLLTSLPTPPVVEEVLLGEGGALAGAKPGDIFVDTSTIDPSTARRIAAATRERGVEFLDAPVSGGTTGAAAATLTVMVGGDEGAFERARPVLEAIGRNIHYLGPSGSGCIVKLCNQILVGINQAAVAEALVLGAKAGVDPEAMYEVLSTSLGTSAVLQRAAPNFILKGQFEPGFTIDLLYKDLQLATGLGKETGVRLLLTNLAQQVYEEARALGWGGKDVAAVILPLERLADVGVRSAGGEVGQG
ncbi:MAG TPA: NAD(P)-dependent oxidoreductase [Anaerolineae bacterium]|nr:NAD(P)-dependent oxidoreductase [Anaerolineae bacterium]